MDNLTAIAIVADERTVAILFGIDDAAAAVQHGVIILAQGLEPAHALAGGTVEQVSHLAGGELRGGLTGSRSAAKAYAGIGGANTPVTVGDGAEIVSADAAHFGAAALDRAAVIAVGDGAEVVSVDAAHIGAAALDHAAVIAVGDGAVTVGSADAAHSGAALDRAAVIAVGDGAVVVVAADAAHNALCGDRAGFAHHQVLDGAAFQVAHKALIVVRLVDHQTLNGVARAIKGAGVSVAHATDGGPGLAIGDGDIGGQLCAGGGVLRCTVSQRAVDQSGEPEQLIGGGDLIGVLLGARASGLSGCGRQNMSCAQQAPKHEQKHP